MADDSSKRSKPGLDNRPAYNAQIHPAMAEKLYALGLTEVDVAEAFDVPLEIISEWEIDHPEFYAACEQGRSATTQQVQRALHSRATGCVQRREVTARVCGELVLVTVRQDLPPAVAAIRMSLGAGRRPSRRFKTKTYAELAAEHEKKQRDKSHGDD